MSARYLVAITFFFSSSLVKFTTTTSEMAHPILVKYDLEIYLIFLFQNLNGYLQFNAVVLGQEVGAKLHLSRSNYKKELPVASV